MTCPLCHSPDPDHREVHDCPMPSYAGAEIRRLRDELSELANLAERLRRERDLKQAWLSTCDRGAARGLGGLTAAQERAQFEARLGGGGCVAQRTISGQEHAGAREATLRMGGLSAAQERAEIAARLRGGG